MRLHRFFVQNSFEGSEVILTDAKLIHQIIRVLRLGVGDTIILANGTLDEVIVSIVLVSKTALTARIQERIHNTREPRLRTTLYLAILKREHVDFAVEKTTEAGVACIVPVLTQRTVKQALKLDRLRVIAREAAEQSGRGVVPEIREPIVFNEALVAASRDHDICLFFNIGAPPLIAQGSIVSAGLFIGPEGGWAEEELIQAREYDVRETGLGVLTLRAETAAIIATYLVSHSQS